MPKKIRKQIYLEPDQDRLLKALARMEGVSEAEILRRALRAYPVHKRLAFRNLEVWEEELAYIRRRRGQEVHRAPRSWRREELHER